MDAVFKTAQEARGPVPPPPPVAAGAKGRLFETGIRLFSLYGYEGTTTRMVAAEAGVNISTISYYFGGKEEFYRAVLQHTAEIIERSYNDIYPATRARLDSGQMTRQEALDAIILLISRAIHVYIERPYLRTFPLIRWENFHHPGGDTPIAEVLIRVKDILLTDLLGVYRPELTQENREVLSRLINGSIMSYADTPLLARRPDSTDQEAFDAWRKKHKKHVFHFLRYSIEHYLPDNAAD